MKGEGEGQGHEALEWLLHYHVEWSGDTLATVETIIADAMTELLGEEGSDESLLYHTLSR